MLKLNSIRTVRTDISGFSELARIYSEVQKHKSPIFDWTNCKFFDANMSAALAACTEKELPETFITHKSLGHQVQNVLQRNLFLCRYGYDAVDDFFDTTIEFSIILPNGAKEFSSYISSMFQKENFPHTSAELKNRITQSLLEIVNNSITHSGSKNGVYCCGQLYPKMHKLKISLVDNGIGIRQKILNELGFKMNSDSAIKWALKRGNTTKKGIPGGLGLDFIKEFTALNKGEIVVISDRGYWKQSNGNDEYGRILQPFPGTAVNITINTADPSSYKLSSE
jgi:signal transduction histidine kinase